MMHLFTFFLRKFTFDLHHYERTVWVFSYFGIQVRANEWGPADSVHANLRHKTAQSEGVYRRE